MTGIKDYAGSDPQKLNGNSPQKLNGNSPQKLNGSDPQKLNGNSPQKLNGNSPNGSNPQPLIQADAGGAGKNVLPLTKAQPSPQKPTPFDRPVILQQSPIWSRAIIWGIVGAASAALAWACLFKIEEAIPATGQLEPQGTVKAVQSPVAGVVTKINVEEGDKVTKGQPLLVLNQDATTSEIKALQQQRNNLAQVNNYYRQQLQGKANAPLPDLIDAELVNSTRDRQALIAENRLFRSQLNGGKDAQAFTPEERLRLLSGLAQGKTSIDAATAQVSQAEKQLRQIEVQMQQNTIQLESAKQTLALNKEIVGDLEDAYKKGAIASLQFKQQVDEVQSGQAEVSRLVQEQIRLGRQMEQVRQEQVQSQAEALNTAATNQRELLDRIALNSKQVTEIDSQLTKAIVENQRSISDLDNRIKQAELTLGYQVLKAPVDGVVFDLQPSSPGFVTNASEPILKIVPAASLKAKVYITNKDIGFVSKDMNVDVRIDTFNFSEFGDIEGVLESIGSDALPPTEDRPFYSFPAVVKLDDQILKSRGKEYDLQSGMAVSVNIKVRDRAVISLITDRFFKEADNFKNVR